MNRSHRTAVTIFFGATPARGLPLVMLALAAFLQLPAYSQAASGTMLQIDAPASVAVGEAISFRLVLKNAVDIAGYESTVLFDTAAAEFAGLHQIDNDLHRMGRGVGSLTVAEMPAGSAIGLYSCPTASCQSLDGPRQSRGASGDVMLATLDIFPLHAGRLEIRFGASKFVDSAGNVVAVAIPTTTFSVQVGPASATTPRYQAPASPWSLSPAAPTIAAAPAGLDLTGDHVVGYADAMEAALDWDTARNQGRPCGAPSAARSDVNHDGCVDIADIQTILASYSAPQPAAPAVQDAQVYMVNTTGDGSDANTADGRCATASGNCSLRAAIQQANAHPGPDTIGFNIPGAGVQTINLTDALPTLNDVTGGTAIDGYTQPGASTNTDPQISNAKIRIQIVGKGTYAFGAFRIISPANTLRGLSLYNLYRPIWFDGAGAHDNVVVGNFIGTNVAGTFMSTGTLIDASGVLLYHGAAHNRIGGSAPADRNVISGTARTGVGMWHEGTSGNVVIGNLVGFDPSGTRRVGNNFHGIDMNVGASYNIIGGLGPGERNVVCCSRLRGIEISHSGSTAFNRVIGNFVGTDVSGRTAPAWAYVGSFGIQVKDRARDNVVSYNVVGNSRGAGIRVDEYHAPDGTPSCCVGPNEISYNQVGVGVGGQPIANRVAGIYITAGNTTVGPGNIIAYNPIGIRIEGNASDHNTITRNSIYSNSGLGIDLDPIGKVNQNDTNDADSGANQGQNFPVLTNASAQLVAGTACPGCTVEIFVADRGAGAYGEGMRFAGAAVAGTDGRFVASLSGLAGGEYLTSTATNPGGNTSEFSLNLRVGGGVPAPELKRRTFIPIVLR